MEHHRQALPLRYLNTKEVDMELIAMVVIMEPRINIISKVSVSVMLIRKCFDHVLRVEVSAYFVELSKEVPAAPTSQLTLDVPFVATARHHIQTYLFSCFQTEVAVFGVDAIQGHYCIERIINSVTRLHQVKIDEANGLISFILFMSFAPPVMWTHLQRVFFLYRELNFFHLSAI